MLKIYKFTFDISKFGFPYSYISNNNGKTK